MIKLIPTRAMLLLLAMAALNPGMESNAQDQEAKVFQGQNPPPGAIWLDSLDLARIEQGSGRPGMGRSVANQPITLKGQVYPHGVGTHSVSIIDLDLGGAATRFASMVGVDDEVGTKGLVNFEVWVDNSVKARALKMRGGDAPKLLAVDLKGAKTMRLFVDNGSGADNSFCHSDWAGAFIELVPGTTVKPKPITVALEPTYPIATTNHHATAIHAPRIVGATPGRPFLFRIPASGDEPLKYSAIGLPEGLVLDQKTGFIQGAIGKAGETRVELKVDGPRGIVKSVLTIVAGPHKLALTPPMGWNSWYALGPSVDADDVRQAAEWMVKSGLAAHGYQYINIDDGWEKGRDGEGRILTNEKFPDMKALADYVHSKGLKFGLYSSPGRKTCGGFEGSFGHEVQDAKSYAEWGVDFLKYDWCSYGENAKDGSLPELKKPYTVMREALDLCGRDIVYSLCQYGMGAVWEWGDEVGANLWRTTYDIGDNWRTVSLYGFDQNGEYGKHAGPGHWNDPDMLMLGKMGKGPNPGSVHLLPNEQIAHMTLWCLAASPLMLSCRLDQIDTFTLNLLTNDEVLDVNQDPLGRPAQWVERRDGLEIWARPLADGTQAVGLFNRNLERSWMTLNWAVIDLRGTQQVRDLWRRKDLGPFKNHYTVEVPAHGAVLLKVGIPRRAGE